MVDSKVGIEMSQTNILSETVYNTVPAGVPTNLASRSDVVMNATAKRWFVDTFHSYCVRIMYEYCTVLKRCTHKQIYDELGGDCPQLFDVADADAYLSRSIDCGIIKKDRGRGVCYLYNPTNRTVFYARIHWWSPAQKWFIRVDDMSDNHRKVLSEDYIIMRCEVCRA